MADTQAASCSGSTQKGPPIRKPDPVCGQRCGTDGPGPGVYFVLLPFTCCGGRRQAAGLGG